MNDTLRSSRTTHNADKNASAIFTIEDARELVGLYGDESFDPILNQAIRAVGAYITEYLGRPATAHVVHEYFPKLATRMEYRGLAQDVPIIEVIAETAREFANLDPAPTLFHDETGEYKAVVFESQLPTISLSQLAAFPVRLTYTYSEKKYGAKAAIYEAARILLRESWAERPDTRFGPAAIRDAKVYLDPYVVKDETE